MDFHENLQEYLFAQNLFLIIKIYINEIHNSLLVFKNVFKF